MQKIINEQVDELQRDGMIEPSRRPFRAPIVLVVKKTEEMRTQCEGHPRRLPTTMD